MLSFSPSVQQNYMEINDRLITRARYYRDKFYVAKHISISLIRIAYELFTWELLRFNGWQDCRQVLASFSQAGLKRGQDRWRALFDPTRYERKVTVSGKRQKRSYQKVVRDAKCERSCAMDRKESQPGTSAASSPMYTGTLQLRFNVSE